MLEMAQLRNRTRIEAGRVALHLGTVGKLPFADATFDAAMALNPLHLWPDPVGGLREVRRTLRPGGRITVAITRYTYASPAKFERHLFDGGFADVRATWSRALHELARCEVEPGEDIGAFRLPRIVRSGSHARRAAAGASACADHGARAGNELALQLRSGRGEPTAARNDVIKDDVRRGTCREDQLGRRSPIRNEHRSPRARVPPRHDGRQIASIAHEQHGGDVVECMGHGHRRSGAAMRTGCSPSTCEKASAGKASTRQAVSTARYTGFSSG